MTHDELQSIECRCYRNTQTLDDMKELIAEVRKLMHVIQSGADITFTTPKSKIWDHAHICCLVNETYNLKKEG